jgi:hypothetical protein
MLNPDDVAAGREWLNWHVQQKLEMHREFREADM